jgi:hypothetical protein
MSLTGMKYRILPCYHREQMFSRKKPKATPLGFELNLDILQTPKNLCTSP